MSRTCEATSKSPILYLQNRQPLSPVRQGVQHKDIRQVYVHIKVNYSRFQDNSETSTLETMFSC